MASEFVKTISVRLTQKDIDRLEYLKKITGKGQSAQVLKFLLHEKI